MAKNSKVEDTKNYEEEILEKIAQTIDPDNTFLDECRGFVKERFNITDKELERLENDN